MVLKCGLRLSGGMSGKQCKRSTIAGDIRWVEVLGQPKLPVCDRDLGDVRHDDADQFGLGGQRGRAQYAHSIQLRLPSGLPPAVQTTPRQPN